MAVRGDTTEPGYGGNERGAERIFARLRRSPRYRDAADDYLLNKAAAIYAVVCEPNTADLETERLDKLLALLDARCDKLIDAIELDDFQYLRFALGISTR
jgi:hypothetical protein